MNRRILIFICVFVIACAGGLGYTYSVEPTYVASARIQVDAGSDPEKPHEVAAFVANQTQALTSNDVLESVLAAISNKPAFWRYGSVPLLREVLTANSSPGTSVIELQARGSERALLPQLLDVWASIYLQSRGTRRTIDRELGIEDARKTVASIEARVARKRMELEEFRRRNNIVSPEREENEVAAEMRSLTGALNDARKKEIEAESRLSTSKAGVAEGKPVYREQDKAAIAQLEQRVLDLRQKLKDLEVKFTPDYLAMDPNVKAMNANIAQLERKIEETRRSSQQAMLNEAAQDVLTAQKNVSRLENQFGQRRSDALRFTSRFAEHKAQTTELAQLEAQLAQARQRQAQLERAERAREPSYELLGRPAVPEKPVHPDYTLYTGFTLGAALIAALFAVLLVEFLSPRPKPEPAYPQPIIQIAYPALAGLPENQPLRLAGTATALPGSPYALPPVAPAMRELTVPEVQALWHASTGEGRFVVAALFSGLTLDELASLKWSDVDTRSNLLTLPDDRVHALIPPFADLLREAAGTLKEGYVASKRGTMLSTDDLAGLLAAAAHDAGLEQAESVDADMMRHTYISFLVRQGARLSELERVVGPLPPASFLHYRKLSPRGPGVHLSALNIVFPAFGHS